MVYVILIAAQKLIANVCFFSLVYLGFVQKCFIWELDKSDIFFYLDSINIFFQFHLSLNEFINSKKCANECYPRS